MPVRKFVNDNGGIVLIIATIVGCSWWLQSTLNDIRVDQQKEFKEQQKQFTEIVEKIGNVDTNSKVRDKDLELMIAKK
ncbi:hypothetical protein LZS85_15670 [Aliivibrio fischeri]|uniref:hypothetical protein n=1 Tax=Aliivibrio fischeri TaxID=668 RepID=UPI001F26E17D|nr:hypothetical protein [Aliivibrio fischeri]MCE7567562.1 hypothetical protein [Aliivibrio fischeri]